MTGDADRVDERWWLKLADEPVMVPRELQDEWRHRLGTHAMTSTGARSVGMTRNSGDEDTPFLRDEYRLDEDEPGHAALWLVPMATQDGFVLIAVGSGDEVDEQVRPWVEAVHHANDETGTREVFTWAAIVGQSPTATDMHGLALAEPDKVGPLHIAPGGRACQDIAPGAFGRNMTIHTSWPLFVTGTTEGYAWFDATTSANVALHRLCALLSLWWGVHIDVRQQPNIGMEMAHLRVPDPVVTDSWDEPETPMDTKALPEWLDETWNRMDDDERLRSTIETYREGLALQARHESFALLAYVAVIEAYGDESILTRCPLPECRMEKGYTEMFRQAVGTVTDDMTRERLSAIYSFRSKTVHEGRLHGNERFAGGMERRSFALPPNIGFDADAVWPMRTAARRIILKDLGVWSPPEVWPDEGARGIIAAKTSGQATIIP